MPSTLVVFITLCAFVAAARPNIRTTIAPALATTTSVAAAAVATSATDTSACPSLPLVPAVDAAFLAQFPPLGLTTPAQIVAGDSVAQALYQSIISNATYATALAFAPNTVRNYNPSFAGYNANTDLHCWWTDTLCTTPKQPYLPTDHTTCNEPGTWGLTVDDGPLPAHCHLYDLYAQHDITASLFYIGNNVLANPGGAVQGYKAGHIICVHTYTHLYTTSLTNEQVFAELYYTQLAIKRVLGYTPRCWRPPLW